MPRKFRGNSFFVGAAIPSLRRRSVKRYERQIGTCSLQVCAHVHVYLIQNTVCEVDSTKNHVLGSYNNYVNRAYKICSVRTCMSVLTMYGLN